jgi:uncharacterized protein
MFIILLHSSKTMRSRENIPSRLQHPALLTKVQELANYVKSLTAEQLATYMSLSSAKALKTYEIWQEWSTKPLRQSPAIDSFIGDIYSGLQVNTFTEKDRDYANDHLYILSGLYGVLRALDSIAPYRLEMGYKLPNEPYGNLYKFWGDAIAEQLPSDNTIINLSSVEYTKAVLPYLHDTPVITPKFMTLDVDGQPNFIVVHAKVARGAFARWLIKERVANIADVKHFRDLNYRYNPGLSTPEQPVFVCKAFGGLGLSVRLS